MHLPRLLASVADLLAPIFILDSGSTDSTVNIGKSHGATILHHAFENHPKQWDYALKNFEITTPWVICLDADQVLSPELREQLHAFNPLNYPDVNGIYFNRKNIFKRKWIKHGGYYPFYMLKMFKYSVGYSDLNENMDHRFIVYGKTVTWKKGHIIEENLKENSIAFWIAKHNRYSDLTAQEEIDRQNKLRIQTLQPHFWGSPDERRVHLKKIWWQMPKYTRPALYFLYRYVLQLGFLDGHKGAIFHFMQGFWFRLVIDIKIDELLNKENIDEISER